MTLDTSLFTVHDVSEFPFVVYNEDAALPGFAEKWETEMGALVAHNQPFVIVFDQLRAEEDHEDRRRRGIWLKRHKLELRAVCMTMISIEPDLARRAALQATAAIAVKAFGIPHNVAADRDEALKIAHRLTQRQSELVVKS